MSIELNSPCCNSNTSVKEYDELEVRFKHPDKEDEFYLSHIPIYTCNKCRKKWAIERVVKVK